MRDCERSLQRVRSENPNEPQYEIAFVLTPILKKNYPFCCEHSFENERPKTFPDISLIIYIIFMLSIVKLKHTSLEQQYS